MAKAMSGKTYAQIVNNRVHWKFTQATLPEYNENDIQVVDVTGNVPSDGDVYNPATGTFSPYVPPAPTQAEINAKARADLRQIDLASIRAIREYIAGRGDAPQSLRDRDAAAAIERAKIV